MKKIVSLILSVLMLASVLVFPVSAQESEVTVYIDGVKVESDVPAQLINSRTMVPLRAIFEKLGAKVEWDDATSTATATKGDIKLSLKIGTMQMIKNDRVITLDVPAQTINDRILVPVRAVAEALDCDVYWYAAKEQVLISSQKGEYEYICPEVAGHCVACKKISVTNDDGHVEDKYVSVYYCSEKCTKNHEKLDGEYSVAYNFHQDGDKYYAVAKKAENNWSILMMDNIKTDDEDKVTATVTTTENLAYQEIYVFHNDWVCAMKEDGTWDYLNAGGEVLPLTGLPGDVNDYELFDFSDGFGRAVAKDKQKYFVNTRGEYVFDQAAPEFNEQGIATVTKAGNEFYVLKNNPDAYDANTPLHVINADNGKKQLLYKGKLLEGAFDSVKLYEPTDVVFLETSKGKYAYGQLKDDGIEMLYDEVVYYADDDIAIVKKDNKYGFVKDGASYSEEGLDALPYTSAGALENGLVLVQRVHTPVTPETGAAGKAETLAYYVSIGNGKPQKEYDVVDYNAEDEIHIVRSEGKFAYVKDGVLLKEQDDDFVYVEAEPFVDDLAIVKKAASDYYYVKHVDGALVFAYKIIQYSASKEVQLVQNDEGKLYGFIKDGKLLNGTAPNDTETTGLAYTEAKNFVDGFAKVKVLQGDKNVEFYVRLVETGTETKLEYVFDKIEASKAVKFPEGYLHVSKKVGNETKYGVVQPNGEFLADGIVYDRVDYEPTEQQHLFNFKNKSGVSVRMETIDK